MNGGVFMDNEQLYGVYKTLLQDGYVRIKVEDITKESLNKHYEWVLNIIRDYIETDFLKVPCVLLTFTNDKSISLGLVDWWYNLIMWTLIVLPTVSEVGRVPQPGDLFFPGRSMTVKKIKSYIDEKFIDEYRSSLPNRVINNCIDDAMYNFLVIDEFSLFLMNTINLEDAFIRPMEMNKQFYDILHLDFEDVSLEDAKDYANKATEILIDMIKADPDNPLTDYFIAEQCIKRNQFRDSAVALAQKPTGRGGIFPVKLSVNFINGGTKDLTSYFIESSNGRTAQIVVKNNTGDSGHLARLLGLNSMDTILHPDPHHNCGTNNLVPLTIKSKKDLNKYLGRWFRFEPFGREYKITRKSDFIIGKTIYIRTPMTCASREFGGVCYRCYGDLAYTNRDINIGKFAAEALTAKITQRMLSAKHLLEAAIRKFKWNPTFLKLFDTDANLVVVNESLNNINDWTVIIDSEDIDYTSDEGDARDYNMNITSFEVRNEVTGEVFDVNSEDYTSMYFTEEFISILNSESKKLDDSQTKIEIPLAVLSDVTLFVVFIANDDLSEAIKKFTHCINRKDITTKFDLEGILAEMNNTLNTIGIHMQSVHAEIILANLIRHAEDILLSPDWTIKDVGYQILPLLSALRNNPSITKSLSFQDIARQMVNPLTYEKSAPSEMDLFYMVRPQEFLDDTLVDRE